VDEAIRRRFNLIPFTVTIPPEERDETLPDKLNGELPGILAWMIDGCTDWQERGLAPPEIVTAATAAYLESEDALSAWIEETCQRDPNAWEKRSALFASWVEWAEKSGEYVGSQKQFIGRLEAKGFGPKRMNYGRGFHGLRLISTYE
jgi:putative DNA primase/helicase